MRTGFVCRKPKTVGGSKNARVVEEYEINTALIESLNSAEKRAAIETGQEVDRADIGLGLGMADKAAILQKAFTLNELEAIEARIEAVQTGQTVGVDAQPDSEPGKPGCARPTGSKPPKTGASDGGEIPSVPKAPRRWRG